jgi:Trypsin-like peptidase domain
MKKWTCGSIALWLLSFTPVACTSQAITVDNAHKASLQIYQEVLSDSSRCSATAIGPQVIITATHCELPSDDLAVLGVAIEKGADALIVGRLRDKTDHTIYLLDGVVFDSYVAVILAPPLQMDEVYTFGYPGKLGEVYQKGTMVGTKRDDSMAAMFGQADPDELLFDFQAYPGISGSGVFNQKGQLVAVIGINEVETRKDDAIEFAGAFLLGFTQEQLDKARAYRTEVKPVQKPDLPEVEQ